MSVLAIHGGNYKMTQLAALDRHNFRKNKHYSNDNIDHKKTKDNIILVEPQGGLYQAAKRRIEIEVLPYQNRALRKDANWVTEFILTLPIDVYSRDNIRAYCDTVLRHIGNKVGYANVISAVIHTDEVTPHMHLDFTPITQDHRLSSKQIMTREFLTRLHDDLPKVLRDAGFDVQRGEPVPVAARCEKARDIRQYKKEMEHEKQNLGKQIKALELLKEQLLSGNLNIARQILDKFQERQHNRDR